MRRDEYSFIHSFIHSFIDVALPHPPVKQHQCIGLLGCQLGKARQLGVVRQLNFFLAVKLCAIISFAEGCMFQGSAPFAEA